MIIEDAIEKYFSCYEFMCFNIGNTKCYVKYKYAKDEYKYINIDDIVEMLASKYIYRGKDEYYQYIRYKKLLKFKILNNY